MKIDDKIKQIRAEIKQLCNDLGIKTEFKMLSVANDQFDEDLVKEHESKRNELRLQWKEQTNDLDDFLMDLENSSPSEEESECKQPALPKNSDQKDEDINSNNNDDAFQWMSDGKKYKLLTDKERKEVQRRAELKHQAFVERFQQFKEDRKQQLSKGGKDNQPQTKFLNKTRKGYAFVYRFSRDEVCDL